MINKYRSLDKLHKAFMVVSFVLVLLPILLYVVNVVGALSMDKSSYNCTSDSMMMQICHDPFGSSIAWSILGSVVIGFPVVIVWLLLGVAVLAKFVINQKKSSKPVH